MATWLHLGSGGALLLGAWLVPRRIADARGVSWPAAALDIAPVVLAGFLLLVLTGRPLFAGFVLLSLGAGLALADWAKRDALQEPVVFSDMSELPQVFTHPQLYLPFAGTGLVLGGAAATAAVLLGLLWFEPVLWQPRPIAFAAAAALAWAAGRTIAREPILGAVAGAVRRLDRVGEPFADARALGPFAALLVGGIIARAERPARQAGREPPAPAVGRRRIDAAGPVVLVQCESFFDARRLSPLVPAGLLPGFDACLGGGAVYGRLDVSGWGANTMRTEFAALTGIPDRDLGYDRFNPYHAFARVPIASIAWHLRALGYRTVCLHPFDRRFFRRDLTLPALGFDIFLGGDELGAPRRPPYCPDPELAGHVLRALDAEGPQTFVFAITMGNHGPWHGACPAVDRVLQQSLEPSGVPQGGELLRYLDGLRRSDEMLQILAEGLTRRRDGGLLGFYGDHLPSLPRAFRHFGFAEWSTDYVLWPGGAHAPWRLDLAAHELAGIVLDRLQRGRDASPASAVLAGGAA
jgi:hypothetical protein